MDKHRKYTAEFKFLRVESGRLYCSFCNAFVTAKKSCILQHKSTAKHQRAITPETSSSRRSGILQPTISSSLHAASTSSKKDEQFKLRLTEMMLECNIPLNKLQQPSFKQFIFDFTGFCCPDESTCRKLFIDRVFTDKLNSLRSVIADNPIYLILDETVDVQNRMVFNIMVGVLSSETLTVKSPYLLTTIFLKNACTSESTLQALIKGLQCLYPTGIKFDNIRLIVTDAAPYMVKAITTFQSTFATKAIFLTCLAHGLHRVAENVRLSNPDVDKLVSSIKKFFSKSPSRRVRFAQSTDLPLPPDPVIVRWGTWLNAVRYYADHFKDLKHYFMNLEDDKKCPIIQKVKDIFTVGDIVGSVAHVASSYGHLPAAIAALERDGAPLTTQIDLVENLILSLPVDKSPHGKLKKVLAKNPGYNAMKQVAKALDGTVGETPPGLSPNDLMILKYAPVSSSSVERSFSVYRDILSLRRESFSEQSLIKHLFVKMNTTL